MTLYRATVVRTIDLIRFVGTVVVAVASHLTLHTFLAIFAGNFIGTAHFRFGGTIIAQLLIGTVNAIALTIAPNIGLDTFARAASSHDTNHEIMMIDKLRKWEKKK